MMKIQIDGTNTVNKGAELMLYAVLEQIEQKYPEAEVVFNTYFGKPNEINTNLKFKKRALLSLSIYPDVIFRKLGIPQTRLSTFYPEKGIDVVFDASGFRFGDQWKHSDDYLDRQEKYFKSLKKEKTKIIMLPQALGPFSTSSAKRSAQIINKYVDYIYAREIDSYDYLIKAGVDKDKASVCTDFTNIVDGISSDDVAGKVCIIPNQKMISETDLKLGDYVKFINNVITYIHKNNLEVFLLNHEGEGDLEICKLVQNKAVKNVPIISNKNAKEVKGIIGDSYAVIASRFHGVASSLSQSVPCLATSWSHKYEMLFNDYGLSDYLIEASADNQSLESQIDKIINKDQNLKLRNYLNTKAPILKDDVNKMWESIWSRVLDK
ncbi:MAG: polysaccharide pyruvyl transferase family protein [Balneolaceae bacterium]